MTKNIDFKGCLLAANAVAVSRHSEPLGVPTGHPVSYDSHACLQYKQRIQLMLKSMSERFCLKSFKDFSINHENKSKNWIALHNPSPADAVPTSRKRYSIVYWAESLTREAALAIKEITAFTLAEVLITLGIIGVVAALTIPALMASYEKMVLKQQFKKTYSMISQAFTKVTNDYGGAPECYYYLAGDNVSLINSTATGAECVQAKKDLRAEMKIIKTCESRAYEKGCIPKYKGFDTMAVENNPDLPEEDALRFVAGVQGFYQNSILNSKPAFVLSDGTVIIEGTFPRLFAVDINGKKGPNKWGYDLFSFWSGANNNTGLKLIPTTYLVEKGGKTTLEMVRDLNK